jgi:uncharacterized membrane protein YczE
MNWIIESIGIIATLAIIVAFLMKGELKIRVIDTVGAVIFVAYGVLIGSLSVILLNVVLIFIQLYHINKLTKGK